LERVVPEEELISTVTEYSHEIGYTIAAVVFAALAFIIIRNIIRKRKK
jgi:membrane protein DedA with SNARE-associated domain